MSESSFKIEATEDTPFFSFDKASGSIIIRGISMPENAFEFYDPLEKKILSNISSPPFLEIELSYMNSMSNKQLLKLIKLLAAKKPELKVLWKYKANDTLIKLKGEEIAVICNPIEIKIEEIN